jgi:hypothetical protein
MSATQTFPSGWNEHMVRAIIAYYDKQTEEEIVAEINAAYNQEHTDSEKADVEI